MIDLYFAPTPNGLKLKLFMEETALPHQVIPLRLSKGDQFKPEFLALSPNGKIPAMVDHAPADGGSPIALFESGALLLYLAEKTGRFMPNDLRRRMETLKWLFWQVGGLGPMAGQAGHFRVYAPEQIPYGIDRYTKEVQRLYGVLDDRLGKTEFIAGDYSIADMACFPWVVPHKGLGQRIEEFPHLDRWFQSIEARPAVARAYEGVEDVYSQGAAALSDAERETLFGKRGA